MNYIELNFFLFSWLKSSNKYHLSNTKPILEEKFQMIANWYQTEPGFEPTVLMDGIERTS